VATELKNQARTWGTRPPFDILLAVDKSKDSDTAARLLASLKWPVGTIVHVLTVLPDFLPTLVADQGFQKMLANVRHQRRMVAQSRVRQVVDMLNTSNLLVKTKILEGRPSEAIMGHAERLPADLIVIGATSFLTPGEFELGVSATAHRLVHYADYSVLVVRPRRQLQSMIMVFATDDSPAGRRACSALPFSVPLSIRITEIDGAEDWTSVSADAILSIAREQNADLIVVDTRNQTNTDRFPMGGASKVVRYALCSVLVVRQRPTKIEVNSNLCCRSFNL